MKRDYHSLLDALEVAIDAISKAVSEDALPDAGNLCGYLGWYLDGLAQSLRDAGALNDNDNN